MEVACSPFFQRLADILADQSLVVCQELRKAILKFKFPPMTADHLQYVACEKRQWMNHLAFEAMKVFPSAWNHAFMKPGTRLQCFMDQMPESRFNPNIEAAFLCATPLQNLNRKGTYASRRLGPSISDAAEPPKRVVAGTGD